MCPENIKITDNAIIPLKERVVDASYDPIAWLGRKIRNRTKGTAAEAAAEAPATGPAAVQPPYEVHGIPAPELNGDTPPPTVAPMESETVAATPDSAPPEAATPHSAPPVAAPGDEPPPE